MAQPSPFTSHAEVLRHREALYAASLISGTSHPFLYPHDTFSLLLLLGSVLFIPKLKPVALRRPASLLSFALIVALCVSCMRRDRTVGLAGGYAIGLMCSWGMVWSAVLLVYRDVGKDFQRIEWRENGVTDLAMNGDSNQGENLSRVSKVSGIDPPYKPSPAKPLQNRRVGEVSGTSVASVETDEDAESSPQYQLVWQGHPEPFLHRLDWCIDICTSFRGPGWNWRISTLPAVDIPLLPSSAPSPPIPPGSRSAPQVAPRQSLPATALPTLKALRQNSISEFVIYYLLVDTVKSYITTDPYFWGVTSISSPYPSHIPLLSPILISSSPFTIRLFRTLLCATSVYAVLSLLFSLSPLCFPALATLAPNLTRSPLHEPFLYPPYWGPLASSVLDKGLPGCWGRWWHQVFRFGFEEPSRYILDNYLPHWDRRSPKAKFLQTTCAFVLSGALHASASYTTFSYTDTPSRPLQGPFAFFVLQGIGVMAQTTIAQAIKNSSSSPHLQKILLSSSPGILSRTSQQQQQRASLPSPRLRKLGNLVFVVVWFWYTGPVLSDDFARCGVWLLEPLPISVWRGLAGQGWWQWGGGRWVGWWKGESWWRSGLAFY